MVASSGEPLLKTCTRQLYEGAGHPQGRHASNSSRCETAVHGSDAHWADLPASAGLVLSQQLGTAHTQSRAPFLQQMSVIMVPPNHAGSCSCSRSPWT